MPKKRKLFCFFFFRSLFNHILSTLAGFMAEKLYRFRNEKLVAILNWELATGKAPAAIQKSIGISNIKKVINCRDTHDDAIKLHRLAGMANERHKKSITWIVSIVSLLELLNKNDKRNKEALSIIRASGGNAWDWFSVDFYIYPFAIGTNFVMHFAVCDKMPFLGIKWSWWFYFIELVFAIHNSWRMCMFHILHFVTLTLWVSCKQGLE